MFVRVCMCMAGVIGRKTLCVVVTMAGEPTVASAAAATQLPPEIT